MKKGGSGRNRGDRHELMHLACGYIQHDEINGDSSYPVSKKKSDSCGHLCRWGDLLNADGELAVRLLDFILKCEGPRDTSWWINSVFKNFNANLFDKNGKTMLMSAVKLERMKIS